MSKNALSQAKTGDIIERYVDAWLDAWVPKTPSVSAGMRPDIAPLYAMKLARISDSLFPLAEVKRYASMTRFSAAAMEPMADYQVKRAEQALREQLGMPLGLADERVVTVVINPAACDYATALTKSMSRSLLAVDAEQGLDITRRVFSRMWMLDGNDFAHYIAPDDIETVFRGERKRGGGNPAAVGHGAVGIQQLDSVAPSVCVVFGVLPEMDKVEFELLENEALLRKYLPVTEGSVRERVGDGVFSRASIPMEEYWNAYVLYLKNHSKTSDSTVEPLTPESYHHRLRTRDELRDARLKRLQAYTGIQRTTAIESDVLAGSQAILIRIAEVILAKVGRGFVSFAADAALLSNDGMINVRRNLSGVFDRLVIDEVPLPERSGVRTKVDTFTASTRESSPLAVCSMTKTAQGNADKSLVLYGVYPDAEASLAFFKAFPAPSGTIRYTTLFPKASNAYALRSTNASPEYASWFSLPELAAAPPIGGLMEKRRGALIDIDKELLEERMRMYFDQTVAWESLVAAGNGLTVPQSRFEPKAVRKALLHSSGFSAQHLRRYGFKPFDERWCYHSAAKSLWGDPKANLAALAEGDNRFFVARSGKVIADEGVPFFFTTLLCDTDLLRGHSYCFPLWVRNEKRESVANLSGRMVDYFRVLGLLPDTAAVDAAKMMWNHVLAITFAPAYLQENFEAIGHGWPRIPFPGGVTADAAANNRACDVLQESSQLGEEVAALLDLNAGAGEIGGGVAEFCTQGVEEDTGFGIPVTVGWGKRNTDNSILPSHGRLLVREYSAEEKHCLEVSARAGDVHAGGAYFCLGDETFDIHLNENMYVKNIPAKVWRFTVGGYPILKKWLSYRDESVLGRPLTRAEVDSFCKIARLIAALLLMGPRLNRNYAVTRDLHFAAES